MDVRQRYLLMLFEHIVIGLLSPSETPYASTIECIIQSLDTYISLSNELMNTFETFNNDTLMKTGSHTLPSNRAYQSIL